MLMQSIYMIYSGRRVVKIDMRSNKIKSHLKPHQLLLKAHWGLFYM